MRTIEHWVGGSLRGGADGAGGGGRTSPVWNPATGEQQAEVVLAEAADVDAAVAAARDAFAGWSQTSVSARTKVLFAFRELVNAHAQELAELITDEHGQRLAKRSDARSIRALREAGRSAAEVVPTGLAYSGTLKNAKLAENAPVTIRFALLSLDGTVVGEQEVVVNAPAPDAETQFEAQATVTGNVAGWRYTVAN